MNDFKEETQKPFVIEEDVNKQLNELKENINK
jgi:hypothetical protein